MSRCLLRNQAGILSAFYQHTAARSWSGRRTLEGVLDDGDDALELFRGEVTGALGQIDIGLLADQVGVSATDTLDLGQGVHDLLLAIDVCVQQTDDVLEAVASQHLSLHFTFLFSCP
jgi:hypothetical protein